MFFSIWTSEAKCSFPSEASSANWQIFLQGETESQCCSGHWGEEDRLHRVWQNLLEESQADGAPLKLSGFPVAWLDDLLGKVGQSSGVEAVTLRTGAADELVKECDCLLTRILTLVFHHASLREELGGQRPPFRSLVQQSMLMHFTQCGRFEVFV